MTGLNNPPPIPIALLQALDLATPQSGDDSVDQPAETRIQTITYVADHVLFSIGDLRDNAYLIDDGEVVLKDAAGEILCTLGAGEVFGEMALLDGGERTAHAVTTVLSDIFVIPRTALQNKTRGLDPVLSLLIGLLIERYRVSRIHMPESIRQDQVNGQPKDHAESQTAGLGGSANIRRHRDDALKELKQEQELRLGLEREEFIPVLQPIMKLPERQVAGFEALIRWYHPEKGLIFPDTFIPVAERTGVIKLLDKMMLRRACHLIPAFLENSKNLPDDFFISVNLSGVNFETLDVIQDVREALVDSGVDPRHLKLEITESALIIDPEKAEQVLHGLRALGVTIALDDFGTGYSSLGYLHKFPIDSLKIDRSFVSQIHDTPKSLDIVRAIVGLARNFKLGVIAEGIETERDAEIINMLGCEMAQGYLFGKPMSSDDAQEFIYKNSAF